MTLEVVGCSHHQTPIALRERLAFDCAQACAALDRWRVEFPDVEAVLLSTCNRVEFYLAAEGIAMPGKSEVGLFLAGFHGLAVDEISEHLFEWTDGQAAEHLFSVAASLDSMVVGEPQILSQVKQAYQLATKRACTGPLTHAVFQAALRVARRVADETNLHQHRISVPSVAVADFARQIFERFDDKKVLVVGGGETAEETLRYLRDEGARDVVVVNRDAERAGKLARRWHGRALPWEDLLGAVEEADLVVSTTGSPRPVVSQEDFARVEAVRKKWPLVVLDLAVPRDFAPTIGARPGVYLYSIDDLQTACEANRRRREKELPTAMRIVKQETSRFLAETRHRATGPLIQQLTQGWAKSKEDELRRLLNKLPELDERSRAEIRQAFDRLLSKLLHPPLESIRDESRHGIPTALLDALARLFQLKD